MSALLLFGITFTSCEPSLNVPVVKPTVAPPPVQDTVTEIANDITLSDENLIQIGEAYFYEDSLEVIGEGFHFQRKTPYGVVRILFDEDGKICKVETMTSMPFKQIDKNTIFLSKGANLTMISRHFGVPIQRLMDCNTNIKNPNKIPALTRLKLNCNQ